MDSLVRRSRGFLFVSLASLASLTLVAGCGRNYGPYPATALEVNERVLRVRSAFEKVKAEPLASEVRLDLQRAETWIVTAEAEAKGGKVDERADLYLTTAEGQLSMIQTHYARRKAEEKLAKRRDQALAPMADETPE